MKKLCFIFLLTSWGAVLWAQQVQDSTRVQVLDEVLVRSVRVEADSPITHSNVSKEELQKRNLGQDIPILLNYQPSVVTTSDAGAGIGYTGIRIRGVDAQSTNITINGIPYNDQESLGTFWVNLPDFTSSVESLQIQRGVGTSTNGSGAFGASVNILTDAVSDSAYGEIANAFGSYNSRKHNVKFSTGKLNNHYELSGRLSQINSDGYVDRAFSDLKSYFIQGAYVSETSLIKAITFGGHERTYQAWYGLTIEELEEDRTQNPYEYENEIDNYKQDHYQLHWNEKWSNYWSSNIGLNYTYGRGYFEQYREDDDVSTYGGIVIPDVDGGDTTDLIRRRWLDNDFYVINVSANYRKNEVNLKFGASISDYDGDHYGEVIWARSLSENAAIRDRYYEGNGRKKEFSLFAKSTYRLNDALTLFGDLQLRKVSYKTKGITSDLVNMRIDENYNFFNPKAGISYQLNNNNNFYFSYARGNREPSRSDFENNPNIKPEQLNDFELGWRLKKSGFGLSTNVYYMHYNEQLVMTGAIDDVGAPVRDNSGESYRLGLEVAADITLLKDLLYFQPNFTLSSNKNKEVFYIYDGALTNFGETNLAFSPSLVSAANIVYNPAKNLSISFLQKYVGEQYMGNIDSEGSKLDAYYVADLNINYELKLKSIFKSIVFSALVNNIFDSEYVSNGYWYTYDDNWSDPNATTTIEGAGYYPQATRNFLIGATIKF